jgi:hypothetical protein
MMQKQPIPPPSGVVVELVVYVLVVGPPVVVDEVVVVGGGAPVVVLVVVGPGVVDVVGPGQSTLTWPWIEWLQRLTLARVTVTVTVNWPLVAYVWSVKAAVPVFTVVPSPKSHVTCMSDFGLFTNTLNSQRQGFVESCVAWRSPVIVGQSQSLTKNSSDALAFCARLQAGVSMTTSTL